MLFERVLGAVYFVYDACAEIAAVTMPGVVRWWHARKYEREKMRGIGNGE
jgi:hypothetical protein